MFKSLLSIYGGVADDWSVPMSRICVNRRNVVNA